MATKAQIKKFAKDNNVSMQEAKEHFKVEAKNSTKQSNIKISKNRSSKRDGVDDYMVGYMFGVFNEPFGVKATIEVKHNGSSVIIPTRTWKKPITAVNPYTGKERKVTGLAAALIVAIHHVEKLMNIQGCSNFETLSDVNSTLKVELIREDGRAYAHMVD